MAELSPAAFGRLLADEDVLDFVLRRLAEAAVSERANATHADRIEPGWAETLAARDARLTQLRDRLAGAIQVGRGGV